MEISLAMTWRRTFGHYDDHHEACLQRGGRISNRDSPFCPMLQVKAPSWGLRWDFVQMEKAADWVDFCAEASGPLELGCGLSSITEKNRTIEWFG
jgi:hypothetical protein